MKLNNITIQNSHKHNKLNKDTKKELVTKFIVSLTEEQKMKFWIKTLLSSQSVFPEIIKTLDKIIELQASSVSFTSDIYGAENSTLKQFDKVINLSERKTFLLNLNYITKELTSGLSSLDKDFLEKRYVYNMSVDSLAAEFDISPRTVYRKIDKLVEIIYDKLKKRNWTLKFLESQIRDEFWLKSRFISHATDYFKNSNYSFKSEPEREL